MAAKCCSSSVEQNPKVEENVFVQILLDEFVILFGVFDSGRQRVSRGSCVLMPMPSQLPPYLIRKSWNVANAKVAHISDKIINRSIPYKCNGLRK